MMGENIARNM